MRKWISILVISLSVHSMVQGQELQEWIASRKSILYEKLFVHIDRQFYSPGDFIWFKVYHLRGLTHRPMEGFKNIYVQLVSDSGKVWLDRVVLAENGLAKGDILIPDSVPDGNYHLRAFTKYLLNFGQESFYHQKIFISRSKSSLEMEQTPVAEGIPAEVAFLPEGGILVLNTENHIAFKAIDNTGKGVEIRGYLTDERDSVITAFRTSYLGMGRFSFTPEKGRSYFAKIENHPALTRHFSEIVSDGAAIHITQGNNPALTIKRNPYVNSSFEGFLVISHKGVVLYHQEISFDTPADTLAIPGNLLPAGINKLTLLDRQLTQLSERLYFQNDSAVNGIELTVSGKQFETREKVTVEIELDLPAGDTVPGNLSLSVVNRNYLSGGSPVQTLKSYMLLDSELKGDIECPACFFEDEDGITQAEKLDLLMLVNGWRSYYWNELTSMGNIASDSWNDAGITVEGYVRRLFRNRPISGGQVVIGPFSGALLYEGTVTDSLGRFRFDRLYLKDMEAIFITAKNEKDRANTEIVLDPVLTFDTKMLYAKPVSDSHPLFAPVNFYRDNYYRHLRLDEYYPDKNSILLGKIDIIGKKRDPGDGHVRLYPQADHVHNITADDNTYANVLDYLTAKGKGIIVSGDQISIRGGGMPLFLHDGIRAIDGTTVEDILYHIPMGDIDKIEIITDPGILSMFGSQGGNGVIAIYSKKGGDRDYEINRYVKGRTGFRVKGFRKPAQFYTPKYTISDRNRPEPDYRPTLHWDPDLIISGKKMSIGFFTSDELADYVVVAEGVNKSGKLFSGITHFSVTSRFDR